MNSRVGISEIVVSQWRGDQLIYVLDLSLLQRELPRRIYPSYSAHKICASLEPLTPHSSSFSYANPDASRRLYFHCEYASGGRTVVAERCLRIGRVSNFRDLGGYSGADGREVKWGCLYRSGQLSSLDDIAIRQFEQLDIRLVCDFRREEERRGDPTPLRSQSLARVIELEIDPGSHLGFFERIRRGDVDSATLRQFMCDINQELAAEHVATYRQMFMHLLALPEGAALVHCTAGKDRTGFAVAMLLAALGVSVDDIYRDYLLSQIYFDIDSELHRVSKKYSWGGPLDEMRPVLEVHHSYLQSAFDVIDNRFGGIERYLVEQLGIDASLQQRLRERFLMS